ncbi:RagB/SusD family nutrient uptake outer membrane protein [uncultured Muribaculum sp.]|uniref:RagB/SusD family nutrient uptake outer membrane protein n=1 Tax=uncultured Muribaculum sp. TaxID=1918613 RepID=UPI0025D4F31E|nr:RagB/SusD family nutrient uptake outer membrane protein [uncultured Muribaculum sp.]
MYNKIFNIKNLLGGAIVATMAFASTSCSDDFLDVNNPNQPSSGTFWASEADALMALTGCYDAMQSMNLYNDHLDNWNFGFLSRETSTDNGDHTWGNWMLGSSISECTSGTNDECFSMYWKANYELIKRCNEVTANIDRIPADASVKNLYRAEAMALRALGYCNLTSTFRDVPYFTEPLTMATAKVAKTEKSQIVDATIAELKANLPALPVKGQNGIGRMSREAGYAILGRIALFAARYDDAIDAYKQVYGKAQLFKDGDGSDNYANFRNLFTEANENADEVLLSVHYKGPALGEGQTFGIAWKAPMNAIEASMNLANEYYCTDGLPITESSLFPKELIQDGDKKYTRTNQDLRMWENRDPRLKGTLFVPGMTWNGSYKETCGASSTVHIFKWYTPENTQNEYDGSLDYYVIRYAEVLLSYAEALIEKGTDTQTAKDCIDEVRQRVGMPKIDDVEGKNKALSQADLRKIVRHERRVELAFEDLRFADLYRWGEFGEAQKRMQQDRANGFGTLNHQNPRGAQDTVWPIPQGEIDTNDNLVQHDEWK